MRKKTLLTVGLEKSHNGLDGLVVPVSKLRLQLGQS